MSIQCQNQIMYQEGSHMCFTRMPTANRLDAISEPRPPSIAPVGAGQLVAILYSLPLLPNVQGGRPQRSGAIHGSPNSRGAGHSIYRSLLASRSDSSRVRMSPSRTGPLTFLMIRRFWSSKNFTRTWVTCPLDPVRPMTFITIASFTCVSMVRQQRCRQQAGGVREQQDSHAPCTNL